MNTAEISIQEVTIHKTAVLVFPFRKWRLCVVDFLIVLVFEIGERHFIYDLEICNLKFTIQQLFNINAYSKFLKTIHRSSCYYPKA